MRLLGSEREEEGELGIDGRGVREDASEEKRRGQRTSRTDEGTDVASRALNALSLSPFSLYKTNNFLCT